MSDGAEGVKLQGYSLSVSLPGGAPQKFRAAQQHLNSLNKTLDVSNSAMRKKAFAAARNIGNEQKCKSIIAQMMGTMGDLPEGGPTQWGEIILIGAVLTLIRIYETRGRFHAEVGEFDQASNNFGNAKALYNSILSGSHAGGTGALAVITNFVADNSARILGKKGANPLFNVASSVPELWARYAALQLSSTIPENSQEFKGIFEDPYKVLDPALDLKSKVDGIFSQVTGLLGKVGSGMTQNKSRLAEVVSLTKGRLPIAKANFYLKLAKVLKIKNPKLAEKAIALAIEILTDTLDKTNNTEIIASSVMALTWAYSTRAGMSNEVEKNAGKLDALRAVGIYKLVLYGPGSLDQELKDALSQPELGGSQELIKLLDKKIKGIGHIKESLQALRAGKSFITGGKDVLAALATNELELNLNLANTLALAERYDEALEEFEQIFKLEKMAGFKDGFPCHELVYIRAHIGQANALVAKANDLYQASESLSALTLLEGSMGKLEGTLSELETQIVAMDANPKTLDYELTDYIVEYTKAADTLAWAYATRGRITLACMGNGKQDLEAARTLYEAFHFKSGDQVLSGEPQDLIGRTARLINKLTNSAKSERLIKIQVETGLIIPQLYLRRADILKDLKLFAEAQQAYLKVTKQDRGFNKAQISILEMEVIKARYLYTKEGDLKGSYKALKSLLAKAENSLIDLPLTASERIRAKLLIAQIYGTQGWLAQQKMEPKLSAAKFKKSMAIYEEVLAELKGLKQEDKEKFISLTKETGLTIAGLYLTLGDLKRVEGDMLGAQGKALYLEALGQYTDCLGALPQAGDLTRKQELMRIQAQAAQAKAIIALAKLKDSEGETYSAYMDLSDKKIEELTADLKQARELKHYRLAFDVMNTLTWILGTKGGIKEALYGSGAGKGYFLSAADIYKALLGLGPEKVNPATTEIGLMAETFLSEEFLLLSEAAKASFYFNLAELTKAAGNKDKGLLEESQVHYAAAREELKNLSAEHPTRHLFNDLPYSIDLGEAEAWLNLGQLLEKEAEKPADYARSEELYLNALKAITSIIDELSGKKLKYFSDYVLGIKALKDLKWALGNLGRLREALAEELGGGILSEGRKEYQAALVIDRILLFNESPKDFSPLWKKIHKNGKAVLAEEGLYLDLSSAIKLIKKNKGEKGSLFLQDLILYAAETHELSLKLSYLGNLIAAKHYGAAIKEYEDNINQLEKQVKGTREKQFLASIHASIGDVYCFKLQRYNHDKTYSATVSYKRASQILAELKTEFEKLFGPKYLLPQRMRLIEHQISFGMGKINIEEGDFEDALDNYKDILKDPCFEKVLEVLNDPQLPKDELIKQVADLPPLELDILVRAHLSMGDVYSYHIENPELAVISYKKAQALLQANKKKTLKIRRMLAQSYLGLGDVYRLRLKDYEAALGNYKEGILTLAQLTKAGDLTSIEYRKLGQESRKVLSQLYAAAASVFARLNQPDTAEEYLKISKEIISSVPADPYDPDLKVIDERISEEFINTYGELSAKDTSLELTLGYVDNSYPGSEQGSQPTNHLQFGLNAGFPITSDLNLNLGYLNGFKKNFPAFSNPGTREDDLERLELGRSHHLKLGLDYDGEAGKFFYGLNPFVGANVFPAAISDYDFSSDYSSYEKSLNKDNFWNLLIGLNGDLSYKLNLSPRAFMLFSFAAGLQLLINPVENAVLQAQEQGAQDNLEAATDPAVRQKFQEELDSVPEKEPVIFSWFVKPGVSFNLPSLHLGKSAILSHPTLSLGTLLGQDPIGATEQGFWPLEVDTLRAAGTFGLNTALNLGENYNWRLPINLYGEFGTHLFLSGELGLGYQTYNWGLEGFFGISYYKGSFLDPDDKQATSTIFNFGLRTHF